MRHCASQVLRCSTSPAEIVGATTKAVRQTLNRRTAVS
jgi:hypothetical protein